MSRLKLWFFLSMFFPISNILFIIIFLNIVTDQIIQFLLYFLLLLSVACIPYWIKFFFIAYTFLELLKAMDFKKDIEIDILPYIDDYTTFDLTPQVLSIGQFIYCFIFISFIFLGYLSNLIIIMIFFWIYFVICCLYLITFALDLVIVYREIKINNKKKEKAIQNLIQKFHEWMIMNMKLKIIFKV